MRAEVFIDPFEEAEKQLEEERANLANKGKTGEWRGVVLITLGLGNSGSENRFEPLGFQLGLGWLALLLITLWLLIDRNRLGY